MEQATPHRHSEKGIGEPVVEEPEVENSMAA